MMGAGSVGKTALCEKYVTGLWNPLTQLTIGVDFHIKTMKLDDKTVKLQIWDMGGEDRFRFLLSTYCLGAQGALFLYDTTRPATLSQLQDWVSILFRANGRTPVLLVGTKVDLVEYRAISFDAGMNIAKENGMAGFVEVSAKEGINVEEAFESLTRIMLKNMSKPR
jgi:small GTP-binding protein